MILKIKRNIKFFLPVAISLLILIVSILLNFLVYNANAGMVDEPGTTIFSVQHHYVDLPVKDIDENTYLLVLKVKDGKIVKYSNGYEIQKILIKKGEESKRIYTDFTGDQISGDFYIGFVKETQIERKRITVPIDKKVSGNTENIKCLIDDKELDIEFNKITIKYDRFAPVIKSIDQANDSNGAVILKIECEENYGLDVLNLYKYNSNDPQKHLIFSKKISDLEVDRNGKYIVEIEQNGNYAVSVNDFAKLESNIFDFEVKDVDFDGPVIDSVDKEGNTKKVIPPNNKIVYKHETFTVNACDAHMDDMMYGMYYAGKDDKNPSDIPDSDFSYQLDNKFDSVQNGTYFFKVKDKFGYESDVYTLYVDDLDIGIYLYLFAYSPDINDGIFTSAEILNVYFLVSGDLANTDSEILKASLDGENLQIYNVSEDEAEHNLNLKNAINFAKNGNLRKVVINNTDKRSYKGKITITAFGVDNNSLPEISKDIIYDAVDPVISEEDVERVKYNNFMPSNWLNIESVIYRFKAEDPAEKVSDEEVFETYKNEIIEIIKEEAALEEYKDDDASEKDNDDTPENTSDKKESVKIYEDPETGETYEIPMEKWLEFKRQLEEKNYEFVSGLKDDPLVIIPNKKGGDSKNNVTIKSHYIEKDDVYEVIFSVPKGHYADFTADFYVMDKAGRKSNVIRKSIMLDDEKPEIKKVNFTLYDESDEVKYEGTADKSVDSNQLKGFAKNGEKLTITIEAVDGGRGFEGSPNKYLYFDPNVYNEPIELVEEISQDGKKCKLSQTFTIVDGKLTWTDSENEKSFAIDDEFKFDINKIDIKDAFNQACEASAYYSKIVYYAPLEYEKMNFTFDVLKDGKSKKKNDNDELIANEGDKITFSFEAHHKILTNNIYMGIHNEQIDCDPKSEGGICSGSFVVKNLNKYDNKKFKLYCEIKDEAGNILIKDGKVVDRNTISSNITYYAPIKDCIKNLSLTTNNPSVQYTKDGDLIKVFVKTSHPIRIFNAEIARNMGTEVTDEDDDPNVYCIEYTLKNGDLFDNEDVPFILEMGDASDNEVYKCTNINVWPLMRKAMMSHGEQKKGEVDYVETEKIVYYAPIEVNDMKMNSTNLNPAANAVKNGDRVNVHFSANHEVNASSVSVSNHEIILGDDNKRDWDCSIDITDGFTEDLSNLTVSAKLTDRAGNVPYILNEREFDSNVRYFAPVQISDASIVSSNSNDERKYAKNGDDIKLVFNSNHEVYFSTALLCDRTPEISDISEENDVKRYEFDYTLKNQDLQDQSVIMFSFEAYDIAGNKTETITNEYFERINQITYYAPIVNSSSMKSGNRNTMYVNNGGRIIVSGQANHGVIPDSALINGREANISGRNSDSYSIYYIIDNDEKKMPEGAVSFSYNLSDKAGNTTFVNSVNDNTTVIYDRTLPEIKSEFENISFSNHSIKYKFTFFDDHISPQDLSVKVNGEEQISDEERNSIVGCEFTKEIILSTDDNYRIVVNSKDLANNASSEFNKRITLDTTKPEIKTINLLSDKPEIYKSAFDIRDHFEFKEKNLKEIICIVTNSTGSREWDINDPIVCDGKNTVYLMISDMAGNLSQALLYDFYIDGTAPKAIILEALSNELLTPEENKVFFMEADFKISLEALHVDRISKPDKFEKLYIVSQDDEVIVDLLDSPKNDPDFYTVSLKDPGNYILCVEATDSVGNSTGLMKYPFEIREKSLVGRIWDNKLVLTLTVTGICLLLFGTIYVLIFKRVRKSRQEWEY